MLAVEQTQGAVADGAAGENERRPVYNIRPSKGQEFRVKLVEECAGVGSLRFRDRTLGAIPYRISRFQGLATSGLPIPGLPRIEGTLALASLPEVADLVGADVTLELEDGRSLALTVADDSGRVLAEGHGPRHGCGCC